LYLSLFTRYQSYLRLGRVIAQAISRWLPTVAARVRARVWSSGICGGQGGAQAGFLLVLRFPLPISILIITRGRYDRSEVADVSNGPSLDSTPQYANLRNKC
jgi:hypothetical protein